MKNKVYISGILFSIEESPINNRDSLKNKLKDDLLKSSKGGNFSYITQSSGKPKLIEPAGWNFSISHKKEIGVYAYSKTPLGVDIEEICPKREYNEIAKEFFNPIEYQLVQDFGIKSFYHIWSRKEAWIKLKGLSVWDIKKTPILIENSNYIRTYTLTYLDKSYSLSICLEQNLPMEISIDLPNEIGIIDTNQIY